MRVQELRRRVISAQPGFVTQESVNLVRKNEFRIVDTAGSKSLRQPHRLGKCDIVVIIALDDEYRRAPGVERRYRRCRDGRGDLSGRRVGLVERMIVALRQGPVIPVM